MATRDHALDGLRGMAALGVAGGHCLTTTTGLVAWAITLATAADHEAAEVAARLGYLVLPSDASVMLFFVLSGHVLWGMFERRYTGFVSFPRCLVERLWRLLPVSMAAGLLFGAAVHIGYIMPMDGAELLRTMFILSRATNGVLWSLQVEIVASVLLFGAWALAHGRTGFLPLFLLVAVATFWWTGSEYALYMPAFLLGAMIRDLPERFARRLLLPLAGLPLLVGSSFLLGHGWEARVFETIGAFLIVTNARALQPRWLCSRPVQFLGLVSYPFYLIHPLGVGFGVRHMPFVRADQTVLRVVVLFALSTLAALTVAWILHRLVERPAMRLRLLDLLKAPRTMDGPQAG